MPRTVGALAIVLAGAVVAACGGGGGGGGSEAPPAPLQAALAQVASCSELRDAIVDDARQKISVQADRLRADAWLFTRHTDPFEPVPAPTASPAAGEAAPSAPGDFTDTNVQVEGVDEADVVETDGARIYLLHGSELLILDSFPPEATALAARVAIEGSPIGMFVDGNRALVISQVFDSGELGGDDACRWIGPPFPEPLPFARPASDVVFPCGSPFIKVTLLDLAAGSPRVAREIFLEGYYVAARRHGERARVIVGRGWGLPPEVPDPWVSVWSPDPPATQDELIARVDAWERDAIAAIEASALDEWLPAQRERVGGSLVDIPLHCDDAHVPAAGLSEHGVTRIIALDMTADDGLPHDTLVMGGASQVYASGDTLVLAHLDWGGLTDVAGGVRTALHVFDLPADSLETTYRASGFIPGTLLSQFAIDVRGDVLRVATTLSAPDALSTTSRVTTARVEEDAVVLLASTGDLAPGERIFAVRFLGDRAYVVTFRQVDPLFVIDLADPLQPTVLGEVELPGFSEYLHPLGEHHLLTVGRDATPDGVPRGVALRIFDVSDPTAPRLAHLHLLPGDGWSPAATNHLVFTFDPRLGILALPYNRFDESYRSSLVLLGVDATAGFAARGEIEHDGPPPGTPCPPGPFAELVPCDPVVEMQRGLFIESWIYSISSAAVQVHALGDLSIPVAEVRLP